MEILGLEVPLWVSLTTIILSLLYWYGTSTFNTFKKMGVPYQPAYIPFVGHMIELMTTSMSDHQEKYAKKFPGKVYGMFQGRTPVLKVADAEFVKEVTIKEFSSFMNRRPVVEEDSISDNSIVSTTSDHWKHVRTILAPTFTSGKLKQMYPVIQRCSQRFVKHLKSTNGGPIVIKDYASGYTMDVIASTAFGLDLDVQETTDHEFIYHAKKFFGLPTDDRIITRIKSFFNILSSFLLSKFIKDFLGLFVDMSYSGLETLNYLEELTHAVLDQNKDQIEKRNDFISMCADKVVDLGEVDKDSIRMTRGKTWTTQGTTY
ncbi:CYP3A131 [Bugula neritina]|uniref:CYP3A131 n=1 Tax=Bugula neritina TaxID=10212 RepID=A0A7J7KAJ8_BUGNE|nr:CYP3A131 [Bugula neritina]